MIRAALIVFWYNYFEVTCFVFNIGFKNKIID